MTDPVHVELLTFEGCPSRQGAIDLAERAATQAGVTIALEVVDVTNPGEAERRRFLGSPTLRVRGRDVEPGADERSEFALSCRIYASPEGPVGLPPVAWVRDALVSAHP
jgi:hypothetical protein